MRRRRYLQLAGGTAAIGLFQQPVSAQSFEGESTFINAFDYAVADFFRSDWNQTELEEAVDEAVDLGCSVYDLSGGDASGNNGDHGYLSQLSEFDLSGSLAANDEVLNWLSQHLSDVADYLGDFSVLSDQITDTFSEAVDRIDDYSRFVPVLGALRTMFDSGCSIHSKIEREVRVDRDSFIQFFKSVALVGVEIVLLATGIAASYRVAYSSTGVVNRNLINVVGQSIGWNAYSWVLSQIHWGIRVAFSGASGVAIDRTVEEITTIVVSDAADVGTQLTERDVSGWVRNDVEKIDRQMSNESEPLASLIETLMDPVEQVEKLGEEVDDWIESLNLPF